MGHQSIGPVSILQTQNGNFHKRKTKAHIKIISKLLQNLHCPQAPVSCFLFRARHLTETKEFISELLNVRRMLPLFWLSIYTWCPKTGIFQGALMWTVTKAVKIVEREAFMIRICSNQPCIAWVKSVKSQSPKCFIQSLNRFPLNPTNHCEQSQSSISAGRLKASLAACEM